MLVVLDGFGVVTFPKGPCTHIVPALALKYSLYRYIGPKVYATWVHGPLNPKPYRTLIGPLKGTLKGIVLWVHRPLGIRRRDSEPESRRCSPREALAPASPALWLSRVEILGFRV